MAGLSAVFGLIGTAVSAVGSIYSGVQAKASADFEAKSMKQKGDAELAIGQREAIKRRKEKEFALSRNRAIAAASGGGTADESITALDAKIEQEGEYNALVDMYKGKQARNDLYTGAAVKKIEGKSALTSSYITAASGIYSGLSSAAEYAYKGA